MLFIHMFIERNIQRNIIVTFFLQLFMLNLSCKLISEMFCKYFLE